MGGRRTVAALGRAPAHESQVLAGAQSRLELAQRSLPLRAQLGAAEARIDLQAAPATHVGSDGREERGARA